MKNKIFLGIMLLFLATEIHAQNKTGGYIKPDWSPKTIDLKLPKLQLEDSVFLESLDSVLFSEKCKEIISKEFKGWKYFIINVTKTDSLKYNLFIELSDTPFEKSFGYLEHDGYTYCFDGDKFTTVLSISKSKKRFLYKESNPGFIDPPSWILKFDNQTKKIEVRELYWH